MTEVLGIDVGTTYTAAALAKGDEVTMLSLGSDRAAIPTVVVLREDSEVLVGEAADRRAVAQPDRTAREFKRRIGDPVPIVVGGTPYGAEALVAHVLRWVIAEATARLGRPPDKVALSHPASWSTYKTDLLRHAAQQAGLAEVALITEPQAAAVHYAGQDRLPPGATVAVYDLGGGTFDAAVVRRHHNDWELLGVPEGLERFGGIDLDQAVFSHVDRSLDGMLGELDSSDPAVRSGLVRLREECRRAKEALSTDTDTVIPVALPSLSTEVRLTRAELESMIRPRITETIAALERTVASAGLRTADVDRILLVGGSSRIPLVAEMVQQATGVLAAADANPKLAIAYGAALAGSRAALAQPVAPLAMSPAPEPSAADAPRLDSPGARRSRAPLMAGVAAAAALVAVAAVVVLGRSGGGDGQEASATVTTAVVATSSPGTVPPRTTAPTNSTEPPATPPTDSTAPPESTTPPTTAPPEDGVPPMQRIVDDAGVLSAEVPVAWAERLTSPAVIAGTSALQLSASTNQAGFASFTAPGITILAADAEETATPDELVAAIAAGLAGTCQALPVERFSIGTVSGVTQRFAGCGGSTASTVIHSGTTPEGVILLANGVLFSAQDEAAYQRSLESIEVDV